MDLADKKCIACEAGSPALPKEQEDFYGNRVTDNALTKKFSFSTESS
jgi:hypothetical protein